MVTGAVIVLGLLAVFAIELSDTQAKSKADVEGRVHERSLLAAALIDSLFQTSANSSAATDARQLGAPRVPARRLESLKATSRYVVLLDPSGRVIAHSRGFTAQAQFNLTRSLALRLLRLGHPWALGNVLPYRSGGVINFGLSLNTRSGVRYLLTGFAPQALGPFLLGELRQIPGVQGAHNFVLDSGGEVLASTNPARPTGYVFHTPSQSRVLHHSSGDVLGHYFDQVPLANTSWRILLTAPDGPLFASVSGLRKWLPWLIFAAFAVVGVMAFLLALRALRAGDAVREARDELEVANRAAGREQRRAGYQQRRARAPGRGAGPVKRRAGSVRLRSPRTICRSRCARCGPSPSGSPTPSAMCCASGGGTTCSAREPRPSACSG